jgi:ureidoacrylate peracid hydrolase
MGLLRTLEDKTSPLNAALVTVDVQNDFCHERGFLGSLGAPMGLIQEMVPRLERLLVAARARGVPVVHVISHHDEIYASPVVTEQKLRHGLPMELNGRPLKDAPYCLRGTWGAELYGIAALPGEEIVIKHRYSGFHGTNLDLVLRSHGIQSVILTGVATNVCVESTGRDVYMHDYYLVFVGDCTAATSVPAHEATLASIEQFFGQVATSEQIIEAWGARAPTGPEPVAAARAR